MRYQFLSAIVTALLVLAPPGYTADTVPTPADLEKAVRNLGAKDFRTREQASDLLLQAGPAAEAPLRKALASEDPEVVTRARPLIDRLAYGIYPDTPSNVVEVIEQYKAGSRQQAINQLQELGEAGLRSLLAIHRSTPEEDTRKLIGDALADYAPDLTPTLLAQGKPELAEALIEGGRLEMARTRAGFIRLSVVGYGTVGLIHPDTLRVPARLS
jgi:hypothetical protein